MKTVFKICAAIAVIALLAAMPAKSEELDIEEFVRPECMELAEKTQFGSGFRNPDSVMIDTCECDPWRLLLYPLDYRYCIYAKQWFYIRLPKNALNLPYYNAGSEVWVDWREIDSSFLDIHQGFSEIEALFGTFMLKKRYPNSTNQEIISSRSYYFRFEDYVKVDSVEVELEKIESLEYARYSQGFNKDAGSVVEYILNNNDFCIYPNPAENKIIIEINKEINYNQKISIYNIYGKLEFEVFTNTQSRIELNLENLTNGIYFIKFMSHSEKLIIQK